MRFSSPAARLVRFAPTALLLFLSVAGNVGCEDKHIGRFCDLSVPDGGAAGGSTSTINDQALECPTRICLLPAAEKVTDTQSYCTADCSSDEDCEDGETGAGVGDKHCNTGFVCRVATTVGDFCCRRMCICRDFIVINPGGYQIPAVCMSGQSTCQNVK